MLVPKDLFIGKFRNKVWVPPILDHNLLENQQKFKFFKASFYLFEWFSANLLFAHKNFSTIYLHDLKSIFTFVTSASDTNDTSDKYSENGRGKFQMRFMLRIFYRACPNDQLWS